MALQNRYEFLYYVQCINANPNGDPDMGNVPRIDPETMHGYITDVATKRRIRNYIQTAYQGQPGMEIIMQQASNINKFIAQAHENVASGIDGDCAKGKEKTYAARSYCCSHFFDVRCFGAVLSTGANAGQVRGPVQLTFGRSIDPILSQDISITRVCTTQDLKNATFQEYENWENEQPENKLRGWGRKQFIPFGLYEVRGFISGNLARETGFDEKDLQALCEAILNMYEHDHSASKGQMSVVSPLILFRHTGTDSDENQRQRQALLGCAPAHRLFDLVQVRRKPEIAIARDYRDYTATIALKRLPAGVEAGFQTDAFSPIIWGRLPDGESWLTDGN
ncbi:MAG: type I-C CRISPR-associated protein Cas7/Csd2 [Provencibacterium sp.]|jgi:CRISPR-associated protein Csd2|nr:type I-C CRISPR-associated protein Cas7/Csd2 [Provencibacterium sp.]